MPGASSHFDPSKSRPKIEHLGKLLENARRRPLLLLTHNNPDPDTIAGACGLSFLLKRKFGTRCIIGYGGVITRAENRSMIQRLRIKMTQLKKINRSKYYAIALVDGQPGTGNNLLEAGHENPLIVIDHHPLRKRSLKSPFHDIRPNYGATSTIITEYILAAGLTPTRSVANALLYGIKTDTNSLSRGACNADFEAFNYLAPLTNPRVLGWIENPPLTQEHLIDYCRGLGQTTLYRDVAISDLGQVHNDDIIAELADLLLRLDGVSWALCMGLTNDMLMLSLRSTSRKYHAARVIRRLIGQLGAAGGHAEMAAGQVSLLGLEKSDKQELSSQLVQKFLKIIDRHGCQPKPLVSGQLPSK